MENAYPFYLALQIFKVLLIKIYKIQPPVLFFPDVLHVDFSSSNIIFHKFLLMLPKLAANDIYKKDLIF